MLFQSTRPRGARLVADRAIREYCKVSIHAPAWGATIRSKRLQTMRMCFNPRARVGRDRIAAIRLGGLAEFQSTRPRGARQKPVALYKWLLSFNPRARVGRDIIAGRLV